MKAPKNYKAEIEARIREGLEAEESGDIDALYALTLPSIRERREREMSDEPQLTFAALRDFVERVKSASLVRLRIRDFHPTSARYGEHPTVLVEHSALYNQTLKAAFRALWVKQLGTWHTTATGKIWFDRELPRESDEKSNGDDGF